MNKNFFRCVWKEMNSLFGMSENVVKKVREPFLVEYFIKIEKNINLFFQKIRNEHERN